MSFIGCIIHVVLTALNIQSQLKQIATIKNNIYHCKCYNDKTINLILHLFALCCMDSLKTNEIKEANGQANISFSKKQIFKSRNSLDGVIMTHLGLATYTRWWFMGHPP